MFFDVAQSRFFRIRDRNFGVPMRALTKLLCFPGDLLLNLTSIEGDDHRGLVRMLANSVVWTTVGILVTIFIV